MANTTDQVLLNVNTIEFEGRKAVINSYSDHPALVAGRVAQIAHWQQMFPNASVQTERMGESETAALVAAEKDKTWEIGGLSNGAKLSA